MLRPFAVLSLCLMVFSAYLSPVSAVSIDITANVDAALTATPPGGGAATTANLVAGVAQTVTVDWGSLPSPSTFTFNLVPASARYQDTTFSYALSLWWNEALAITLVTAPLSLDTAFVPLRVNVAAKFTATPLSMIAGGNPEMVFSFDHPGRRNDTLALPVKTNLVVGNLSRESAPAGRGDVSLLYKNKSCLLNLAPSWQGGTVRILTPLGRCIGSLDLSAPVQNDLSLWNVAAGSYLLVASGPAGQSWAASVVHGGGDFKLSASFSGHFSLGGLLQTAVVSAGAAETARYQCTLVPVDPAFSDTSFVLDLVPQMNPVYSFYLRNPADTGAHFEELLDSLTYESLFPFRFGFGLGGYPDGVFPADPSRLASDGDYDFYTYNSLLSAIGKMGEIEVDIYQIVGENYMHRIVWRNKSTGVTRNMVNNVGYAAYQASGTEVLVQTVDYGKFCAEGDMGVRSQELAAFFGNISHETTGMGEDETTKRWGLYWREEVAWQNGSTSLGYVDQYPNALYPPTGGQSYHGRGPIQITHNVNYGQLSEFLYGDKQILLDNPGMLVPAKPADATVAFMSAIWFWMTPQAPKPSCHDVMAGNWVPSAADIAAKRTVSKFGMTVNIINGGQECGKGLEPRVEDRAGFYKRYIGIMGGAPEADCNCDDMGYYP